MALIANDAPNVTRLTQLEVVVRAAHHDFELRQPGNIRSIVCD